MSAPNFIALVVINQHLSMKLSEEITLRKRLESPTSFAESVASCACAKYETAMKVRANALSVPVCASHCLEGIMCSLT